MDLNTLPASINTPAEDTRCLGCLDPQAGTSRFDGDCEIARPVGVRFSGDEVGETYAHCPRCGSTDLVDVRHKMRVLLDWIRAAKAAAARGDVHVAANLDDTVARMKQVVIYAA